MYVFIFSINLFGNCVKDFFFIIYIKIVELYDCFQIFVFKFDEFVFFINVCKVINYEIFGFFLKNFGFFIIFFMCQLQDIDCIKVIYFQIQLIVVGFCKCGNFIIIFSFEKINYVFFVYCNIICIYVFYKIF